MTDIVTVNPATGDPLASYGSMDDRAISLSLETVAAAQPDWARRSLRARVDRLAELANVLERRRVEFATLITTEMGKRLVESLAEIDKCVATCRYYVEHAEEIFTPHDAEGPGSRNQIRLEPLGTILAIMPWNFPFWQVIRFAVPALLVGNGVLIKHAPNTTGCALAIETAMIEAEMEGIARALVVDPAVVPTTVERLINHDAIGAVTFTGSTPAGAAVAAVAGRAVKKSVLELGGSDPFVVLDDCDLEQAVSAAVASRFGNCGQSCLAAKRFIVHKRIADEFTTRFVESVSALRVGDPFDEASDLGPMARDDLRDALCSQVLRSVDLGAEMLVGQTDPSDRPGWWQQPIVLSGGERDRLMPAMAEETFGPAAIIAVVDHDDRAVELANDTPYGLAASIWSSDVERALSVGRRVQSGALFINRAVASDARLPFGGVRRSGYGRELGTVGAHEFANVRPLVIDDVTLG
ncbi:aldehyde dehydrogenase family protein [Ilumatobacter fluminis]|nr:aldehyde dehydrogenase family protein [Ilumatobacter fluminis]